MNGKQVEDISNHAHLERLLFRVCILKVRTRYHKPLLLLVQEAAMVLGSQKLNTMISIASLINPFLNHTMIVRYKS